MFAAGPDAVSVQDLLYGELDAFEPLAIHEHESGDGWRVFFRSPPQRDSAHRALASALGSRVLGLLDVEVDDEDWARRSQAGLTAVSVGRITVAPPWDVPASPAPDTITIVIDPSMGFGTGHHATTRLCLEMLLDADVAGKAVIDIGTGSGVLAIAAWMLGARPVVAIDHDPDALHNARENVERNGAGDGIEVIEADLERLSIPRASVIVANLTAAMHIGHPGRLQALVEPGGLAILSGFAPDEAHGVGSAWPGWRVHARTREGDWAAVSLMAPLR